MSCNFYVRTCVKFTFANKTEAMHERSLVSVKVDPRSTSRLSSALFIWPAIRYPSSLFVWETRGKGLFSSPPSQKDAWSQVTFYVASTLLTWLKFTCVNVRRQIRVSGNHPLQTLQKSRRNHLSYSKSPLRYVSCAFVKAIGYSVK